MSEKFAIIGSGIIGLSLGIELKKSHPNCSVTIFEKEVSVGQHASGRISEFCMQDFTIRQIHLRLNFVKMETKN